MRAFYGTLHWGSEGGLRYRLDPIERSFPPGTRWHVARDSHAVVGCALTVPMTGAAVDVVLDVAIRPDQQGRGWGKGLAEHLQATRVRPLVAMIEAQNKRSARTALGRGGRRLTTLQARVFTRRFPMAVAPGVERTDTGWRFRSASFDVVQHRWNVTTLGGPFGAWMLRVLPSLGIRPDRFEFLSIHGVRGSVRDLSMLMSVVLRDPGVQALIATTEPGTDEHARLSGVRRGWVGRLIGSTPWDVWGTEDAVWPGFERVCAY